MNLRKALTELANDIKREILRRMSSEIGFNPRVGRNTLVGSDLYYSVDVFPRSDTTLVFQIADYWEHVVKGWERTKQGKGTFTEYLFSIRNWIRKKNIVWKKPNGDYMTENEMTWVLAKKMFSEDEPYRIAPRPFITYDKEGRVEVILDFLDDMVDAWRDDVFNKITEEIDKYFT